MCGSRDPDVKHGALTRRIILGGRGLQTEFAVDMTCQAVRILSRIPSHAVPYQADLSIPSCSLSVLTT
jgi:hypothetical protein